jgi:hypothetical protein
VNGGLIVDDLDLVFVRLSTASGWRTSERIAPRGISIPARWVVSSSRGVSRVDDSSLVRCPQ